MKKKLKTKIDGLQYKHQTAEDQHSESKEQENHGVDTNTIVAVPVVSTDASPIALEATPLENDADFQQLREEVTTIRRLCVRVGMLLTILTIGGGAAAAILLIPREQQISAEAPSATDNNDTSDYNGTSATGINLTALHNIVVAEGDTFNQSGWMLMIDSTNSSGSLRDNDPEGNPQSFYAFVGDGELPMSFAGWKLQSNGQFGSSERFRIIAFDKIGFPLSDGWSLSAKVFESYERDSRDKESNYCFAHSVGNPFAWKISSSNSAPGRYRISFVTTSRDLAAHRYFTGKDIRDENSTYVMVHDIESYGWEIVELDYTYR